MTNLEYVIAREYANLLREAETRKLSDYEIRRFAFLHSVVRGYKRREVE